VPATTGSEGPDPLATEGAEEIGWIDMA